MDTNSPIICFGQQPNGFFPKRFLVAKINTARGLQKEIGGKIVFFYHDSDADYRETITVMRDKSSGDEVRLNFTQENKLQKKFSPLYLKRIPAGWKEEILKQLPRFVDKSLIDVFSSVNQKFVADFCLEMYLKMGLLERIEILRSSDKSFREQAPELAGEFFADVEYRGEIVRAKIEDKSVVARFIEPLEPDKSGNYKTTQSQLVGILHEGGNQFIRFPINESIQKWQKSANRDQRFAWMQSVINCTHYIYGEGEKEYLDTKPFPNIEFIDREKTDQADYAQTY